MAVPPAPPPNVDTPLPLAADAHHPHPHPHPSASAWRRWGPAALLRRLGLALWQAGGGAVALPPVAPAASTDRADLPSQARDPVSTAAAETRHEQQLRLAEQVAQIGSFEWYPAIDALHWSDQHFRLWGLQPGVVTPSYAVFRGGVHPDDVDRLEAQLQQALAGGRFYDCVHRVTWPDGTLRHIHARGEVFFDAAGQPQRMIGTVRDVSAEHAVQQALEASVDHLTLTLNATGDGIFASDARSPDQPLLFVNARLLQIWGIPAESAPTLTPAGVIAAARRFFVDPEREVARIVELIGSNVQAEDRLELNDGRVLIRRCVPTLAEGRQVRVWGFRDVTAEARALDQLRSAKEQAEAANRAKSTFLSNMSHELRTPMNAVLGFAQLVIAQGGLERRQREHIEQIQHGGQHLLALINDLLDLAAIEADRLDVQPEPIALHPLVVESMALVRPAALRRGITLQPPPPGPGPTLLADRTRLKQVLVNLLGNAVKYNRDGGWVRVDWQAEGRRATVSVRDSGPGLDEAEQQRLFQPFERLGAARSRIEGTGIGLALCRRLVSLMGGSIGVDSRPGAGSRFHVELPLAEVDAADGGTTAAPTPVEPVDATDAAEAAEAADASAIAAVAPAGASRTVLYVEDNPVNTMLMAGLLEALPMVRMLHAATPEAGLMVAERARPDLVLLDIQLPGMSGYELLQQLRANPATAGLPAAAVSANALPQDLERSREAGFAAHLGKPLDVAVLLQTVSRLLGLPQPRRPGLPPSDTA